MKTGLALSIQQPWAWLIVRGYKDIENRDWATSVRGIVGIHASKTFDHGGYQYVRTLRPEIPLPTIGGYSLGGIVGRANLIDVVTKSQSPWFSGKYGFLLQQCEQLEFMPCRGMPGFFRPVFA